MNTVGDETRRASDALRLAAMLCDVVDTMIPGEGGWPSASIVGVQGIVGLRLLETLGEFCLEEIEAELGACGGPLNGLDEAARIAVLDRLEKRKPKLFTLLRTATYLAYYESPSVIRQVQSLGQPYKAIPGIEGYAVAPFDLDRDRPHHNRGHYVRTREVSPVDVSGLHHLGGKHG